MGLRYGFCPLDVRWVDIAWGVALRFDGARHLSMFYEGGRGVRGRKWLGVLAVGGGYVNGLLVFLLTMLLLLLWLFRLLPAILCFHPHWL